MLTFILGIVAGAILYPLVRSCIHKHDYEVLFYRNAADHGFRYRWYSREGDPGTVYVTYKKCKHCGDAFVTMSNGSGQELFYDSAFVKDRVEVIMKNEREAENKRLLENMDGRVSSADVDIKESIKNLGNYNRVLA